MGISQFATNLQPKTLANLKETHQLPRSTQKCFKIYLEKSDTLTHILPQILPLVNQYKK